MLATAANAPWSITLGGRDVRVANLTIRELGALERWLEQHVPRPTEEAKARFTGLDKEQRDEIWRAAVAADQSWPPFPASPEAQRYLTRDAEGLKIFLSTCLKGHNPTLSDHDIDAIGDKITADELYILRRVAFGDSEIDPKALQAAIRAANRRAHQEEIEVWTGVSSSTPSPPATDSTAALSLRSAS